MSFMKKNSWHLCWIWVFHFIRPKTGENLSQNLVQKSIQHKNRLRMRLRPVLSVQTGPIGPFPAFLPPDPLRRPHLKAARPCSTSTCQEPATQVRRGGRGTEHEQQGQLETQKRSTAWFRMRTYTIIWWPGGESATLYYGMASSILSSFTN